MTGPSTSPSATGQDGQGLVTKAMVDRAVAADQRAWAEDGATPHYGMSAALADAAPDIAAQVRRECAEDIRAEIRAGNLLPGLQRLLHEWSG